MLKLGMCQCAMYTSENFPTFWFIFPALQYQDWPLFISGRGVSGSREVVFVFETAEEQYW